MSHHVRRRLRVVGVVQGVGFRPFVHAQATELGLGGFVGNDPDGVLIEAQGTSEALDELQRRVRHEAPPLAVVNGVRVETIPAERDGEAAEGAQGARGSPVDRPTFRIAGSAPGRGTTSIPPDVAVCADCLAEMRAPGDRRHG